MAGERWHVEARDSAVLPGSRRSRPGRCTARPRRYAGSGTETASHCRRPSGPVGGEAAGFYERTGKRLADAFVADVELWIEQLDLAPPWL